ncbi:GlsB/YeaQ/YmgE family stress response membrane protein [Acanthopleuribacter pedis]|uniref:GlsB/YeaQ/YmgE family stress response membrane protein n=1 Tax=Acanthopleuribacter pedis TaxID=442870 RepID=A0A8J7Q670_9BACT|nr:GlsB/YeaQ/YmgE family stress response membrane protein [Acanthopleuribacter pedis]MBO1318781.1 GlsB/YeaQ/YmgE family stress response membrane protein [Acanthopleuribacter pedis]
MDLILMLLIGLAAGFAAGKVMKGGLNVFGNLIVGIVGSYVGGYAFRVLGLAPTGGLIGQLVTAFVGAVILLALVGLMKK